MNVDNYFGVSETPSSVSVHSTSKRMHKNIKMRKSKQSNLRPNVEWRKAIYFI